MEKQTNCLWCNEELVSSQHFMKVDKKKVLFCSEECLHSTQKYVQRDIRYRKLYYFIMALCIIANLFFFGYKIEASISYIPLFVMALSSMVFPNVFASVNQNHAMGIKKSRTLFRIIFLLVGVFSLVMILK